MTFTYLHSANNNCFKIGVVAKWEFQKYIQALSNPKAPSPQMPHFTSCWVTWPCLRIGHQPWLAESDPLRQDDIGESTMMSTTKPWLPACRWAPGGDWGWEDSAGLLANWTRDVATGMKEEEKSFEKGLGSSSSVEWETRSRDCSKLFILGDSVVTVLLPEVGVWVTGHARPRPAWQRLKHEKGRIRPTSLFPQEPVQCISWRANSDVMLPASHHLGAENPEETSIHHLWNGYNNA